MRAFYVALALSGLRDCFARWIKPLALPQGMQMGQHQAELVTQLLTRRPESSMLVWGLGFDSAFWHRIAGGRVVFLEDNPEWIATVTGEHPELRVHPVRYSTDQETSLGRYAKAGSPLWELDMRNQLPESILRAQWNVILIDAPNGVPGGDGPGRFQSIFTSWLLAMSMPTGATYVLVDDYERHVERAFSHTVFRSEPDSVVTRPRGASNANELALFRIASRVARPHIVILQIHPERSPHCSMARPRWMSYASRQGYVLHWITTPKDGVSAKIQKYVEVRNLAGTLADGNLILLADCDVVVTNATVTIESRFRHAQKTADTQVVVARDALWRKRSSVFPINSGVILFRNGRFARRLLLMMRIHDKRVSGPWRLDGLIDQPMLTGILVRLGDISLRAQHEVEWSRYVTVMPNRYINGFYRVGYNDDPRDTWKPGDWLLHATGMSIKDRSRVISRGLSENDK